VTRSGFPRPTRTLSGISTLALRYSLYDQKTSAYWLEAIGRHNIRNTLGANDGTHAPTRARTPSVWHCGGADRIRISPAVAVR
jgi:hypothetical protein